MLPNEKECRKHERSSVNQTILVKNVMLNKDIGHVANINEDGFMLIGDGEIMEESLYQLTFELSTPVDGVSEIAVGAECLWTKETDTCDQNWAGFHIIDIAERDVEIIRKLSSQI